MSKIAFLLADQFEDSEMQVPCNINVIFKTSFLNIRCL